MATRTPRKPSLKTLQRAVERFNAKFPVGTPVLLKTDSGTIKTAVAGFARVLEGHSAVAWFDGVSGCHAITGRVRLRKIRPIKLTIPLVRLVNGWRDGMSVTKFEDKVRRRGGYQVGAKLTENDRSKVLLFAERVQKLVALGYLCDSSGRFDRTDKRLESIANCKECGSPFHITSSGYHCPQCRTKVVTVDKATRQAMERLGATWS